jgi:hypothetical protein
MTEPLGLPGLAPIFILVWFVTYLGIWIELRWLSDQAPVRPTLYATSKFLGMGCVLTIFGIATKAYYLGLFSQNLGLLTIVMAGLGVGFIGALSPTVQCKTVSRSPQ